MTSAELITELQAARPTADGALRERVRAIALAEPTRRRTSFLARYSLRRLALVAVPATAVVALSVAGVAGLVDSKPEAPRTITALRGSPAGTSPAGTSSAGSAASGTTAELAPPAKADAATPAPTPGRAQRYSAQLAVEVKDLDALASATQRALQTTRDLGGYVAAVSYDTSTNGTSTMTLRVPATRVQDAIVRLSSLGKIVSQQVQIDDLQGQVDALTSRETTLREQIARLSARLASTALDAETRAALEARRDSARAELPRLRAERAQVTGEARYATIQLTLQTKQGSVVSPASSRWDRGLDRAVRIVAVEAAVALAVLAVAGPLALVALAVQLARRVLRRREHERLLSTP